MIHHNHRGWSKMRVYLTLYGYLISDLTVCPAGKEDLQGEGAMQNN